MLHGCMGKFCHIYLTTDPQMPEGVAIACGDTIIRTYRCID